MAQSSSKINCMFNETVIAVVARDFASSCVTHLTLFNHIRFWDQYSTNKESILYEMNKEKEKRILGGEDWIFLGKNHYDEYGMGSYLRKENIMLHE